MIWEDWNFLGNLSFFLNVSSMIFGSRRDILRIIKQNTTQRKTYAVLMHMLYVFNFYFFICLVNGDWKIKISKKTLISF